MIKPIIQQPSYPTARGKASTGKRKQEEAVEFIAAPTKADENFVPSDESLGTLIRSALAALKKGITWDRGSILNLKV